MAEEIKTRRRGINLFRRLQTNAEAVEVPQTGEVTTTPVPTTLGNATKQETKKHRRKVLGNKVQKARK